jgi:LacI family transcriptional regulator
LQGEARQTPGPGFRSDDLRPADTNLADRQTAPRMTKNSTDDGRITLREVARVAGVHPGTASRALNAETRALVNEETARRVLRAASQLGYRPNPIARGLKTNRSYTVGVVIPDLMNPLFPPIVRGIQDRLEASGYTPLIANTDNDPARERIDFERLRARQVDGFITATARRDEDLLIDVAAIGTPVVLVNRRLEQPTLPAVVGDDHAGVRLAVDHLADLGHRRIAYLAGPQDVSTGYLRYQGFVEAMRDRGLPADPELILFGDAFTEAEGMRLCHELLDDRGGERGTAAGDGQRGGPLTAIVAGNDLVALGCYDVFEQRGIRCPDEISVVGFNDMPFADRFDPPLTTIRIPHYEIGARGAELLIELQGEPQAPPRQIQLPPKLVTRASTAPPRNGSRLAA